MKFLIALLVIVCLPLLKGQDFAMAHSQKHSLATKQPQFVQDFIIDDTDEDNDELKCQAKRYSLSNSTPDFHKSRLVDFAGNINYNRNQLPAIPLSSKYILAWALRI